MQPRKVAQMNALTAPGCRVAERGVSPWAREKTTDILFHCFEDEAFVIDRVLCRHGGKLADWKACTHLTSHTVKNLRNGQHVFEVQVRYKNGKHFQSVPYVWKVDTFAPTVLDVEKLFEPARSRVEFSVEAVDSGGSGIHKIECRLYPFDEWLPCSEGASYEKLKKGVAYRFQVRASDKAGNMGPTFVAEDFYLERIPAALPGGPRCQFLQQPVKWISKRSLSLSFQCLDSEGKTTEAECQLGEESWSDCLSSRHHRLESLSLGEHSFAVRPKGHRGRASEEEAGENVDQESQAQRALARWDFVVDDLPPMTVITHSQTEGLTPSFAFNVDENLTPIRESQCQVESHNRVLQKWHRCFSPFTVSTGLQEGVEYVLKVRSVDSAGNVGKADSRQWVAEKQLRPVCLTLNQSRSESISEEQIKVDFFCHGPKEIVAYQCRSNHGEWEDCASPKFHIIETSPEESIHSFQVRAQDIDGIYGRESLPFKP